MNWLDTETKVILQKEDDELLAPPKVGEFSLVLINKGTEHDRLVRAICRINHCEESEAERLAARGCPITINQDLSEEDATLGQFELVCCDAIAAVICSEVVAEADKAYLYELFLKVLRSDEFKPVRVGIEKVPLDESGQRFVDQFLGMDVKKVRIEGFPLYFDMPTKKVRIMKHWAAKIGAEVKDDV